MIVEIVLFILVFFLIATRILERRRMAIFRKKRILERRRMAIFRKNVPTIAEENFRRWNETLQTKDPALVKELYCSKSIFLPTLSGEIKLGQNGAEEYFLEFLEKDPFGVITKSEIEVVVCDRYVHVGKYYFEIGPYDNREIVKARFTMIWQKNPKGDWVIKHHHSSLMPV